MELEESSSALTLQAFTLYPVTRDSIKTCYESEQYKILCSIVGPYYDRSTCINPIFEIRINSSETSPISQSKNHIRRKISEILKNVVVLEKYQRMKFDINFDIIEENSKNTLSIYSALINLLCYTSVLSGLEIKSLFTSYGLSLVSEKKLEQLKNAPKESEPKIMVLAVEHISREPIMSVWEGEFVFLHYQRLANTLITCNEEIASFIKQKIDQQYEKFQ